MSAKISFTLNGIPRTVEVDPELTLLDVIRDVFDLTGTKRGCDNSTCGTCVVVINDKAVKSCNYPIAKAEGAEILTVEGLYQEMELHPVQQAIAESGAVQCGFCTPGIVMELYALLESKPDASEAEMVTALNKHLCRCNGYEPILNGARVAKELMNRK
jgi:carbon-monoxide dehydrogenase small subunit